MKDYFGYQNKICVVTGAASGMGKATTEMLVDLGAKVYALDWAEVNIVGIEQYIHTDLSKKESIDDAFSLLPNTIDSFFGIAGVSGIKTDFNTTVIIDYIANKYITETYLVDRMTYNASIAYITSCGGIGWEKEGNKKEYMPIITSDGWEETVDTLVSLNLNSIPGPCGYMYSKLAMNYYVAHIQPLFAPKKIRVNAVLPAATDSGMTGEFSMAAGGDENLLKSTGYAGRFAVSEEMAQPVVFLNSNMASYLSGVLLQADYGAKIVSDAGITPDKYTTTFDILKAHLLKQ